ncbi:MAG: cupin domain-containing protein [Anaerolineae bacterium]|jgi:quercetin dioxygenase-like cupin family protein
MTEVLYSYRDAVDFSPAQFNPITLAGNERAKVILACLEPGQFIPVHQPGVDLTLIVLEGEAQVVAGEREETLHAGAIVFVPAGQRRGIKAETRLVLLHVVTPPPTMEDHSQVMAGLQAGRWQ